MRKVWKDIFIAVAFGVMVSLLFIIPAALNPSGKTPVPVVASGSVCDPLQEVRRVKALEQWVFEHSSKISRRAANQIVQESLKTKTPLLMIALITVESEFTPTAISSKGAMGLTQVMPGTWEKHLVSKGIIKERRDLFDIPNSIAAGNEVLTICLRDSKGDVSGALERYLGGQDGYYVKRIASNMMNLYYLTESIR